MIFELTDEMKRHLEIVTGEMYLVDDDPELLKMNEDYREIYGEELFRTLPKTDELLTNY